MPTTDLSPRRSRDPTLTESETTAPAVQPTVFAASEARANFMEVIGRVRYGRERLVITNKGKEAAAIVTIEDLKLLQLLDDVDLKEILNASSDQHDPSESWDDLVRTL